MGEISWVHQGDIMIHVGELIDKSLQFIWGVPKKVAQLCISLLQP